MDRMGRPTAEEVISKLKDDGDFDTLRLKIIRKVKENEDLRNSIVTEVKQSVILNTDGSEDLKPRQLSDAIYQELGSKIMGQISDEVWKVIRSDGVKDDISGTVESVYKKLVNPPEVMREEQINASPQPISGNEDDDARAAASSFETKVPDGSEPSEPPGLARCDQMASGGDKVEHRELAHEQQLPCLSPSNEELHRTHDESPSSDAAPPGFSPCGHGVELQGGASDEDPDVPPGFG